MIEETSAAKKQDFNLDYSCERIIGYVNYHYQNSLMQ